MYEKLQVLKYSKRPNWTETFWDILGQSVFEYLENFAPVEELKISLEFFEAWLTDKELYQDATPVKFAMKYCVIEFVDFVNTLVDLTEK